MTEHITQPYGYFKMEVIENGKVTHKYQAPNQIMSSVPEILSAAVFGTKYKNKTISLKDIQVSSLVIGTGSPGHDVQIDPHLDKLIAETNFWDQNAQVGQRDHDKKSFCYQITWDGLNGVKYDPDGAGDRDYVKKTDSGSTYPLKAGSKLPEKYRDTANLVPSAGVTNSGFVDYRIKDNKITFSIEVEKHAANGVQGSQGFSPVFNEAALYFHFGADVTGNPLGTIFSMERFPDVPKTENCSLRFEWSLDFGKMTV